ncbi:MAG: Ig-like domain-containing protein, partial [Eubacteriales bacterium]|nr:Ig-like domain-containing protein [Eubacteriales bacterium]
MKRRLLPWILSVSLCLSLLPAGSFSAEGESQMACSCTQYCLEAGTDETCMVCINDPANCTGKGTAAFSETPEITETVESAEGQSDWESEEQSETEPVTEEVSVESEEETTESSESETDFQEPPSEEVEESEETEETNETEGTEASGETEETEEETATQESGAQSEGISPTLEDIQELIYSLPGAEEMENLSAEEKEAVYAKVQEIRSMLEGLTEEERALLDTTRLEGFLMQTAEKKAKTLRVGDVAEIISADGSHSYASSLQAAIDSAPDGATVKLLENITDTISINVNKTLTLDGNGCSTGIIEINSGTVNVQNLVNGVLDVNGGTANIMGGIVTDLDCQGGTVNIRGGTVTDLNFRGDTVNIWSGSVGCLMLHSGTVNIMGGTVTNLDCWGGTANVASGTIDSLRGDGGTVNYYAIRIWLTNTAVSMIRGDTKTLSVDVQTDYKDPNGCLGTPPIKWESSDTNVVKVDTSGKITAVSNGTAEITASVPTMDSSGKPGSREDICTVTVSDGVKLSVAKQGEGTVSIETKPAYEDYYQKDTLVTVKATAEEGSCFVGWKGKDGAFVSDESTYKFHIQEDTELTAVFQEGVARVIYNGAARTYATLEKAFDAAGDGATIELLQDITEAISINVNKTLTLDGNGHSTGDIEINSGTVNVQNLRNGNEILYVNGGTLNIKSGSVVNRVNCSSGTVSISYGSVDILSCSGSGTASITGNSLLGGLYCYGGTVSITSSRVVGLFCYDSGMVNIMSGDVSSLICNSGEVNVAGGTIHGLKKNGGTVNYYATNIELTDTELSLKRGENKTLLATVTPA